MPTISGPSNVPVNGTATITGTGFTPAFAALLEINVNQSAKYGGAGLQVNADASGNFTYELSVSVLGAVTAAGSVLYVLASDVPTGHLSNEITITLTAATGGGIYITVAPTQVNPGDSITITGSGFSPNGSIQLRIDPVPSTASPILVTTTQATVAGSFGASVKIPLGTATGSYSVTAVDATALPTRWSNAVTIGVGVPAPPQPPPPPLPVLGPTISVNGGSVASIKLGDTFTFAGQGFMPSSVLHATVSNSKVFGFGVTTTKDGIFNVTIGTKLKPNPSYYFIPWLSSPGTYLVYVEDGTGKASNTVTIILIGSSQKTVSASITVTGGFPLPDLTINLFVDSHIVDTVHVSSDQVAQVGLHTPISPSWQVEIGHTVQVSAVLTNPLGSVTITSQTATT